MARAKDPDVFVRPFTPGDPKSKKPGGKVPKCGVGGSQQFDLHDPKAIPRRLFSVPSRGSGMYFPELATLTRTINKTFSKSAAACLRKKRKEIGDDSLQLTIALHEGALCLTYALPVPMEQREEPPT